MKTSIERRLYEWALIRRPALTEKETEEVSTIPGAKVVAGEVRGGPDVIVAAAKVLKVAGVELPKPREVSASKGIVNEYSLRPFQGTGVGTLCSLLTEFKGALLADDMGLGKTRQAIVAAETLACKGNLVAVPASVRDQWAREITQITGNKSVVSLGPVTNKSHQLAWDTAHEKDWVVVSYALLDKAITHAFENRYPQMFIMDEFHLLKGRKAERSKLAKNVAQLSRYRIGTTGTPIWDRPRDLWKQMDILLPGRFSSSGYTFDKRYCGGEQSEFGFNNRGVTNAEELKERLKFYMVRREKREVAKDLPAFTRQFLWIDGTAKAKAALDASILSPSADGMYKALSATLEDKIPAAVELALSARKFVLFTWEKKHAKKIAEEIVRGGGRCGLITGDYSIKERDQAISDARDDGHGIVATIDAAGTGVDGLQHVASNLIFHAISWQQSQIAQAEKRLDRMGQKEPVQATFLGMRDSMDEVVVGTVIRKMDLTHNVMGGDRGARDTLDAELATGNTKQDKKALTAMYEALSAMGAGGDADEWEDDEE